MGESIVRAASQQVLPLEQPDGDGLHAEALAERRGLDRRSARERQFDDSVQQLDTYEAERQHLARELHDELGQRLSAAKLVLSEVTAAAAKRASVSGGLEDLGRVLDDTVDAVRRLARDLRPPMLDDLGLNAALESLAAGTAQRLGIDIELQLEPDTQVLSAAATIAVYRIVQEALTNVTRHAQASRARIETCRIGAMWQLHVDDNGTGIGQRDEASRSGSFGLVGMRERAHLLGGRFSVHGSPLGGTRVSVVLPLESAQDQNLPVGDAHTDGHDGPGGLSAGALEHELAFHEIELRTQNEELQRTQVALAEARDRYIDLYDHAPVGYLTLDKRGKIVEANVTAASLLNVNRSALIGRHFSGFVASHDADRWLRHATRSMLAGGAQSVDVMVQPAEGVVFHAQLDCLRTLRNNSEPVLRSTLADVSARASELLNRRIAMRAVDESEAERRRVARELHEELAQELGALKMELAGLQRQEGRHEMDNRIGGMLRSLDHALGSVRRIAVNLRPPMLDDLGLNAAINWLAFDMSSRTGVALSVSHDLDDPPLDEARSVGLFRFVQSALSVVTQNAAGQSGWIDLHHRGAELVLVIESSGTGWPLEASLEPTIKPQSPLALQAHLLGGRVTIETSTHHSRRIVFSMPLEPTPP
jgi:PAS domain S-box-containing protein